MIIITGASRGVGSFLINSFIKTSKEPVIGIYNSSKPSDKPELFTKIDVRNIDEINNFVTEEIKEQENVMEQR